MNMDSQACNPDTHDGDSRTRRLASRNIRRCLAKITPANSHPQLQSPLFNTLPPEIRNQIFERAVSQHDDLSRPIPSSPLEPYHRHHRLGNEYYKSIFTSLVQTCRLIYYETNRIPMRSATHFISTDYPGRLELKPLDFSQLTRKNQAELEHVHFLSTTRHLQVIYALLKYTRIPQFQPRALTLTVGCESMTEDILSNLMPNTKCLPRLFIHLEKLQRFELKIQVNDRLYERGALHRVFETVRHWKFPLRDGTHLAAGEPVFSRWERTEGEPLTRILVEPSERCREDPTRCVYYALSLMYLPEERIGLAAMGI